MLPIELWASRHGGTTTINGWLVWLLQQLLHSLHAAFVRRHCFLQGWTRLLLVSGWLALLPLQQEVLGMLHNLVLTTHR